MDLVGVLVISVKKHAKYSHERLFLALITREDLPLSRTQTNNIFILIYPTIPWTFNFSRCCLQISRSSTIHSYSPPCP